MGLSVYLFFNGNCEEAMNFYKEVTGGTMEFLTRYGDAPMPCDDADKDRVLHAAFIINGIKVQCSDSDSKRILNVGNNFSLSLNYTDNVEVERVYHALAEGGTITMPLQDTLWNIKFGMLTDKFGINWMLNCDTQKN